MRLLGLVVGLLAAAGCASAVACPRGQTPLNASSPDWQYAQQLGNLEFRVWADTACKLYPYFIVDLAAFGASITPQCGDGKSTFTYDIVARNPCRGNKPLTGSMVLNPAPTKPPCTQSLVAGISQGSVTRHWKQLRTLTCPAGFRRATRRDQPVLDEFLWQFFGNPGAMEPLLVAEVGAGWYCDKAFQTVKFSQLTGCIETAKSDTAAAMAQGVIEWVCYKQGKVRRVGLTVSGPYRPVCRIPVTITI